MLYRLLHGMNIGKNHIVTRKSNNGELHTLSKDWKMVIITMNPDVN